MMALFAPIPGETPIDDLSGLKIKGISQRKQLNVLEAKNIYQATCRYFLGELTRKHAPFDYAWGLRLHEEMYGDVWGWAGQLRWTQTSIGVDPGQIETQLYDVFASIPFWAEKPWTEQAALLHHRTVQIHPFINGNGRWSRLLANIWLRLNAQPYTDWPEESVGASSEIRARYIESLQAADQGDYDGLVALHECFRQQPPQSLLDT